MLNAIHSAQDGISAALERAGRAATTIARGAGAAGGDGDLVGALVSLRTEQVALAANALVVRTADQMLGTMLDLLA